MSLLSWEHYALVRARWTEDVVLSPWTGKPFYDTLEEQSVFYGKQLDFCYDCGVALSYCGILFSGLQFATTIFVYSSLQALDIHPSDYTSASAFEAKFKVLFIALQVLGLLSFTAIAFGASSTINLYFKPSAGGQITARFGYPVPPILFVVAIYVRRQYVKTKGDLAKFRGVTSVDTAERGGTTDFVVDSARKRSGKIHLAA
ncbi:hypothetical protein T492DRAFT_1017086 [Pavlovales sp. CCMP2436]|nr:hypothetical protein T492DRAFT_1017086 [Pavlovales sp. CCMP2436]